MYIAPEVAQALPYNSSIDVYSFGLTILATIEKDGVKSLKQQFARMPRLHQTTGWRPNISNDVLTNRPKVVALVQDCKSTTLALQFIVHRRTHTLLGGPRSVSVQ